LVPSENDAKCEMDSQNKQINDRVLVWLLGSMEPTDREQFKTMATIVEVWSALKINLQVNLTRCRILVLCMSCCI
jgi:hypothetical protein